MPYINGKWDYSRKGMLTWLKTIEGPTIWCGGTTLTWDAYKRFVTDVIRQLKFPCNFQEGKCARTRDKQLSKYYSAPAIDMACCSGCLRSMGYLHEIAPGSASEYARRWSSKTGFWRANTGCILPREMRSMVCNGYYCGAGIRNHSDYPSTKAYDAVKLYAIQGVSNANIPKEITQ